MTREQAGDGEGWLTEGIMLSIAPVILQLSLSARLGGASVFDIIISVSKLPFHSE